MPVPLHLVRSVPDAARPRSLAASPALAAVLLLRLTGAAAPMPAGPLATTTPRPRRPAHCRSMPQRRVRRHRLAADVRHYDADRIAGASRRRRDEPRPDGPRAAWRGGPPTRGDAGRALPSSACRTGTNTSKPGVGFDCSGLTTYAWGGPASSSHRQSGSQISTRRHATDAAEAGDLVQYPGHVMMWLGVAARSCTRQRGRTTSSLTTSRDVTSLGRPNRLATSRHETSLPNS